MQRIATSLLILFTFAVAPALADYTWSVSDWRSLTSFDVYVWGNVTSDDGSVVGDPIVLEVWYDAFGSDMYETTNSGTIDGNSNFVLSAVDLIEGPYALYRLTTFNGATTQFGVYTGQTSN